MSLLLLLLNCFSCVRLCAVWLHRRQPTRLRCPWDSPGKNTGVGCHFLLPCMEVKSETEVTQSCLTLSDPMDCSPPGSSVHGIFQSRVLEWGAIAFSVHSQNNVCWKLVTAALLFIKLGNWLPGYKSPQSARSRLDLRPFLLKRNEIYFVY